MGSCNWPALCAAGPGVAVTWALPGFCCTVASAEAIGASPITAAEAAMHSGATSIFISSRYVLLDGSVLLAHPGRERARQARAPRGRAATRVPPDRHAHPPDRARRLVAAGLRLLGRRGAAVAPAGALVLPLFAPPGWRRRDANRAVNPRRGGRRSARGCKAGRWARAPRPTASVSSSPPPKRASVSTSSRSAPSPSPRSRCCRARARSASAASASR